MDNLPETLILPPRTLARPGAVGQLLVEGAGLGARGVLVHGRSLERSGILAGLLGRRPAGLDVYPWPHAGGEPTLAGLESLIAFARERDARWMAGVGGGSVMDLAKACAGLLRAPLPVASYHDGAELPGGALPFLAAPTTAGTGSESTIVAVLTNERTGVKKSIRHPSMMAGVVILDPELLATCPAPVVAHSGMDAYTQAIEAFISQGASWFSDALALRAAALLAGSIEAVFAGGRGECARDLMQGSYLAGLALSHARLGIVHGLAHPLGSRYHLAHGLVCAVCLPHALAFNRDVVGAKFESLRLALGLDVERRTASLLDRLGIASPFAGRPVKDREGLVRETLESGSTKANPRVVTASDVNALIDRIFTA